MGINLSHTKFVKSIYIFPSYNNCGEVAKLKKIKIYFIGGARSKILPRVPTEAVTARLLSYCML